MMRRSDPPFTLRALGPTLLLLALFTAPAARADGGGASGKVTLEGGPASKVVVYIEKSADKGAPHGAAPKVKQRNTQFEPAVTVAVKGQKVDFPNEDKMYHNVFSVSPGNEFDLGLYRAGATKTQEMSEPGEIDLYCNIHPDMAAKLLVLDNHHYVETSNGSFTLTGVPAGSYTLVAWSPIHEAQKRKIDIKAGATVKADFALKARKGKAQAHLNKNGEQYGRYK